MQNEAVLTETMTATLNVPSTVTSYAIVFFPIWLLLVLAIYAATTILYGVVTLRDYPEAAEELEMQIKQAKKELKKLGVIGKDD